MKTVIIHGQSHQGSTCYVARLLAGKLESEVQEFFLPKDFGEFCIGCTRCFTDSESKCPHYRKLMPLTEAMDQADVIILASPVYVYHATGAMKAFLDHYGWRWMVHRPEEKMFGKQGVCISTAAGAGMKSANKDMADSLFYWGVGKVYRRGFAVAATDPNGISGKKKQKIEKKTDSIAAKILHRQGRVKPGLKTRAFFFLMHLVQRSGWNEKDAAYWKAKGWTGKERPWKKTKRTTNE